MDDYESLSHSKWECKYHVIFIPKCRRKTLYLELRRHRGILWASTREQASVCNAWAEAVIDRLDDILPRV